MARISNKKLAILQRRQRVVELYTQGWTQAKIAAELGCSQPTISADLKAVAEELHEQSLSDLAQHRALELARIDRVIEAAWDAWERSQEPAETTVVSGQEQPGGEREQQQTGRRVRRSRQNRHGDPRYLLVVLKSAEQRRRLLGLDAPPPRKELHDDPLEPGQRRARIVALASVLSQPAPAAATGA